MRWLFVVLLLANLALAGYAWYASHQSNPEALLLNQQVNADKIRIIAPKPIVVPPQPKITCLEWGTFGAGDLKPVQAALAALGLGERLTSHDVQVVAGYWVYIPPLKNKAEVERKIAQLEKLGVKDYYAVEGQGPVRNAVSLGIFKTEEAASSYLDGLQRKGVRSARVGSREHRVTQTAFVVREPDVALTAKLAELRVQFPGSELRAVDCP
ncbi:MAG TPA: SPOR domain-containing protein [Burkholderiales bacterium]|nr:SPOR domain-containing protein [Burkholderiales bacterium]